MPKMTDKEIQISTLKRERARLEERLRLAELLNMEERKTVEAIEGVCMRHGYDGEAEYLVEWLETQLAQSTPAREE